MERKIRKRGKLEKITRNGIAATIVILTMLGSVLPFNAMTSNLTESIERSPSTITIHLNATNLLLGQSIEVTGQIIPPHHLETVYFNWTRPDDTRLEYAIANATDEEGHYWHVYEPDMMGTWTIQTGWMGDIDHYGAWSEILNFHVKKPIIIIPGIMGSVLYEDRNDNNIMDEDEEVWPNIRKLLGPGDEHLEVLKLDENGNDLPGSKINVGDIIRILDYPDIPFISGDEPMYGALIEFLESLGYTEGKDLFTFPYDWRKDICQSAAKLADKIDEVLKKTDSKEVILIAHSMGGLVARYAVKKIAMVASMVNKIIMLGVPNRGATEAYMALKFGVEESKFFGIFGINQATAKRIAENFPGLYQMMPNEDFIKLYEYIFEDKWEGGPKRPKGKLNLEDTYTKNPESALVNQKLVADAKKFWIELNAWDKTGTMSVGTYLIIGHKRFSTELSIRLGTAKVRALFFVIKRFKWYDIGYGWGDETVPTLSAEGLVGPNIVRMPRLNVVHRKMPSDEQVHGQIRDILGGRRS